MEDATKWPIAEVEILILVKIFYVNFFVQTAKFLI